MLRSSQNDSIAKKLYVQIRDLRNEAKMSIHSKYNRIDKTFKKSYDNFEPSIMENKKQDETRILKVDKIDLKELHENSKLVNLMDTSSSQFNHQLFTDEKDKSIEKVNSPTSIKPVGLNTVILSI